MIRRDAWWLVVATVAAVPGCRTDATRARAMPDSVSQVPASSPEPPMLRALVAVPVTGFTGPGGEPFEVASRLSSSDVALHRQIGMRTFALPLRLSARPISQYPCVTCHQGTSLIRSVQPAHDNVRPDHPRYAGGACPTCHVTGAVDHLKLPNGETTTLDQAYRLCAQCHFSQASAWAAGAHGKRLVSWSGTRVVMSCPACHDPHRPGVEPRLPFPGPRIRRTSGVSP